MLVLNRDLSIPQSAGFTYATTLAGELSVVANASGLLVETFSGSVSNTSDITGDLVLTLKSSLSFSGSLDGSLESTFGSTLIFTSELTGSADSDTFKGTLSALGGVSLSNSVITSDLQAIATIVGNLEGGMYLPLGATLSATFSTSTYLVNIIVGELQLDANIDSEFLLALKGTLSSSANISGGIDTPDFISGELAFTSSLVSSLDKTFKGVFTSTTNLSGDTFLSVSSDMSGYLESNAFLEGSTFLIIAEDLGGTSIITSSIFGYLDTPTSNLRRLDKIMLVESIRR